MQEKNLTLPRVLCFAERNADFISRDPFCSQYLYPAYRAIKSKFSDCSAPEFISEVYYIATMAMNTRLPEDNAKPRYFDPFNKRMLQKNPVTWEAEDLTALLAAMVWFLLKMKYMTPQELDHSRFFMQELEKMYEEEHDCMEQIVCYMQENNLTPHTESVDTSLRPDASIFERWRFSTDAWKTATHQFDQATIRNIVSRYPPHQRLKVINAIKQAWHDDDRLPF